MSGKPIELYVDNAAEFKSEALRRGCEQHGIRLRCRPPGQPHFGGIIEPTGCAICVELTLPCSLGIAPPLIRWAAPCLPWQSRHAYWSVMLSVVFAQYGAARPTSHHPTALAITVQDHR